MPTDYVTNNTIDGRINLSNIVLNTNGTATINLATDTSQTYYWPIYYNEVTLYDRTSEFESVNSDIYDVLEREPDITEVDNEKFDEYLDEWCGNE